MTTGHVFIDPITLAAFAPYGDVLGSHEVGAGVAGVSINAGTTLKITGETPSLTAQGGEPSIHVYRTKAQALPLDLAMLECHRYGSQTFVPLANLPFVVVVARNQPESHQPDLGTLKAFWVDGHFAVTIRAGTWHHPLISTHDGDLVVIERAAADIDCLIEPLKPPVRLKPRSL